MARPTAGVPQCLSRFRVRRLLMSLVEANGRDKSSATWRLLPGQQVFMGCRVSELKEHVALCCCKN